METFKCGVFLDKKRQVWYNRPNGNPINYLGTAVTWEKGRQLKTFGANTYWYNKDGIRTKKQTSDATHEYTLDGTNIIQEIVTDTENFKITNEYLYDLDGTVCGLKHYGVAYYFYKNLQGDVIAITNDSGEVVARYKYDAWGKCTIVSDTSGINIATINPFRYRSYYYDTETGLYYLQSRYYDPEVGRFINCDKLFFIDPYLAENICAYCVNDPINYTDYEGNSAIAVFGGIMALGAFQTALVVVGLMAFMCAVVTAYSHLKARKKNYISSSTMPSTRIKILSDVKAKVPNEKVYKLSFVNKKTAALVRLPRKYSFVEAIEMLGITGATNSLNQRFKYDAGESSEAQKAINGLGAKKWGMYANDQSAAKALAVVFGCSKKPEVHASGMYGHYHDSSNAFHVWYGGVILY